MRTLLLFRGAPGCGKSTFIENNGLKPYTLSPDEIRLMCQSLVLTEDGNYAISCTNDKKVWEILFELLEERMNRGEFIVVDSTNSKSEELRRYKKISDYYRYRIICIDMTDIPKEVVKEQNRNRIPAYKRVPDFVIDNQYSRFETQKIPGGIKVIKPEEFANTIEYKITDYSKYDKIHHIGDIHGCYTALRTYLKGDLNPNELYIFTGDFCDRGLENADVLNYLIEISELPNTVFIAGNHEKYIWEYANDLKISSKSFANYTKYELDKANIDKKKLRNFYRKIGQIVYYEYRGKIVLVNHGGISKFNQDELPFIATEQYIKGVGDYESVKYVDDKFAENSLGVYQIHGHRNPNSLPTQINDKCFCLEGEVEFGGCLRCVTLDENGFQTFEIENNVYKDFKQEPEKPMEKSITEIIDLMRSNPFIKEKKFDNISSFNFTSNAFRKGIWDDQTIRARGLFINTNTGDVVTRSFNKFFNINEKEITRLGSLKRNLEFPVRAYVKYNGYLGLMGYDKESDKMIISSKSEINGPFADWFKNIIDSILTDERKQKILDYMRKNNCTLVWEVIDPVHDPHMIKYEHCDIVLINIVENKINYYAKDYKEIVKLAKELGVKYKELAGEFNNWKEFKSWYDVVNKENYLYNDEHIEGFVIEDQAAFMTKIKLPYYSFWKFMRAVKYEVARCGFYKRTSAFNTPLSNIFYGWLIKQDKQTLTKDIITLRDKFYNECDV